MRALAIYAVCKDRTHRETRKKTAWMNSDKLRRCNQDQVWSYHLTSRLPKQLLEVMAIMALAFFAGLSMTQGELPSETSSKGTGGLLIRLGSLPPPPPFRVHFHDCWREGSNDCFDPGHGWVEAVLPFALFGIGTLCAPLFQGGVRHS